ncbi:uncharacterized protein [Rutidosis leptorrhynchoides]|uniref:uncharacterized protein n=1 Tax=Rutidosis leptorrhynchoides TaxID=125765 RepID=UPI003A9A23EE
MHLKSTSVDLSKQRGNPVCLLSSIQGKYQCCTYCRKGTKPNPNLLRQQNAPRSGGQLPRARKVNTSDGAYCTKVTKAIELGEHDIEFQVRNSIKGQVLADFIAETTEEEEMPSTQVIVPPIEHEEWKLFTDGASSSDGSGAGLMLVSPEGKEFTYALCFEFSTTNNEAEYEALLPGLRLARDLNIQYLKVFIDSQLVANQVAGIFEARSPIIQQYLAKSKELIEQFKGFEIEHVRRSQNKKADALSKLTSITFAHLAKEVLVETLERRSIEAEEICDLYPDEENTWMKPINGYLEYGLLPEDKGEARKIRIKAPSYKLQEGKLYRKSFLTPWVRCVGPS